MSTLVDALTVPWDAVFMQRAFMVAVLSGLICGVVGSYVVLRGMAFIGDAVAHAVFPGVAVAFALQGSLVLGGLVAGLATTVLVAVFSQHGRLREDTVIGVFFAGAFGLGIVILSLTPGYSGSLESFLFGQILGISDRDVLSVAVGGIAVLVVVTVLHRQLVTVSLDRETARAAGLPLFWLDLALYSLVTVAIVLSLQAVGNILVLALLVTPAACARLLTDRLVTMMVLAPAIGALSSLIGLYISYWEGVAAGGAIVLVATSIFVVCWLFAPRHGVLTRRRRPDDETAGTAVEQPTAV